jgi:hypothetical protein
LLSWISIQGATFDLESEKPAKLQTPDASINEPGVGSELAISVPTNQAICRRLDELFFTRDI